MAGHRLVVNGRPLTYLAPRDVLTASERADLVGFDFVEDRELREHPRLRRVLTTLVRPTPLFFGVLHWSDGKDLTALDQRVQAGQAVDADFDGALLAEAHTIRCLHCDAHVRVLEVDGGHALFAHTLPERLRAHLLKRRCPMCGQPLGLHVVEFLNAPREDARVRP